MPDTAKVLNPAKGALIPLNDPPGSYYSGSFPYTTSGSFLDISYSPTITWQDTTSAATYSSAASVLSNT